MSLWAHSEFILSFHCAYPNGIRFWLTIGSNTSSRRLLPSMCFVRLKTDPKKKQANLHVHLSVFPTLSLIDPKAVFHLTEAVFIVSVDDEGGKKRPIASCG